MIFIGGLIIGGLSLYARVKAKKQNLNNAQPVDGITPQDTAINKNVSGLEKSSPTDPLVVHNDTTLTVKWANKNFNIASASLAFVLAGNMIFMPLIFIGIIGLIYLIYPTWQKAYYDISQKRRFTRMVLEAILLPLTIITGNIFSAALAYWFLYLALKIITMAKRASIENLTHVLIDPMEKIVYVMRDGIEVELQLAEVQENDVIVLNADETTPINGMIVKGSATIEHAISDNEMQLKYKKVGDYIPTGTRIKTGKILVRVEHSGYDVITQQTEKLLKEMSTCSNNLELRSVDIVDTLALPFFLLGSLVTWVKGVNAGMAMFWVPLDDALYLSGSLGVLNFLKIALKRNILIKDGRTLETLHQVDTLILNQRLLVENEPNTRNFHLNAKAENIISQLKQLGYKLCIISEAHPTSTQVIFQQLDIDQYLSVSSPKETVNIIKEMQGNGQCIAYIDNELNDAMILQQVDVSVSLQDVSTLNKRAAQAILMNKDLNQLIDLLELARSLNKTHTINLVTGAIPTLAIVGGVLTVQLSIPVAILYYIAGMSASVANAMLPLLKEYYRNKKLDDKVIIIPIITKNEPVV